MSTLLGLSVVAEVAGTVGLKLSAGFTLLLPSVFTAVCYVGAVWSMSTATKQIEVGIAYAVWAAASASLIALLGIAYFGESITRLKVLGLALAVGSLVALNIGGKPP